MTLSSKVYFPFAFSCFFSFFFLSAQYFFILSDTALRSLADSLRLLRLRVGVFVLVLVLGVDFSLSNSALISASSRSMRCLAASSLAAASSSSLLLFTGHQSFLLRLNSLTKMLILAEAMPRYRRRYNPPVYEKTKVAAVRHIQRFVADDRTTTLAESKSWSPAFWCFVREVLLTLPSSPRKHDFTWISGLC